MIKGFFFIKKIKIKRGLLRKKPSPSSRLTSHDRTTYRSKEPGPANFFQTLPLHIPNKSETPTSQNIPKN